MIVEIAASTMSYDLGAKLNAYRRNGVLEYVVYRAYDSEVDWFILRDGQFDRLAPDEQGVYRSAVFPGLWLDAAAFIAQNMQAVFATLQIGLTTPEHQAFVQQLQSNAGRA